VLISDNVLQTKFEYFYLVFFGIDGTLVDCPWDVYTGEVIGGKNQNW